MVRSDHEGMVDGRVAPLVGPQEVAIGALLGLPNETVAQGCELDAFDDGWCDGASLVQCCAQGRGTQTASCEMRRDI
eukprot:2166267-Prorocentrum_lima.AAC.1